MGTTARRPRFSLSHCLHDNGSKVRVHAAVVTPDRVHMIFTPLRTLAGDPFTFEEILGAVKGASAHSVNSLLSRRGKVWLDESFDHVLRSAESVNSKCEYICDNPVRKGLVARREDYPWLWLIPNAQPKAAVPHKNKAALNSRVPACFAVLIPRKQKRKRDQEQLIVPGPLRVWV